MSQQKKQMSIRNVLEVSAIVILCILTIVLDFVQIPYLKDEFQNKMLSKIIQQTCGGVAAVLLMIRLKIRLFGMPQKWLFLIPCMIVAIDNFQFSAFFQGKMSLVRTSGADVLLFAGYCLAVGFFEECIFRGIIFSVLASLFPQNKKGFLLTFVVSSLVFGAAHLMNGFSWQIGYTILTGGLFAFCLIKMKNILFCALVHAVYNFGGLLFDRNFLGAGVVFDVGTVWTMLIVSLCVGIFVLIFTLKYPENERKELYSRLGIMEKV